jgi:hypothetical protein
MAKGFPIPRFLADLRARNWSRKPSQLALRDAAIVGISLLSALIILYFLPSPNSRPSRAFETDVANSTLNLLHPIRDIIVDILWPIHLAISFFWDLVGRILRALLGIPVVGDLVRTFFKIITFPVKAFTAGARLLEKERGSPCESLNEAITELEKSVAQLEDVRRARQ